MTISLSANSAVKCALYPTKAQKTLLMRAFVERNRWYNIHVAWFRDAWRAPAYLADNEAAQDKQVAPTRASHRKSR